MLDLTYVRFPIHRTRFERPPGQRHPDCGQRTGSARDVGRAKPVSGAAHTGSRGGVRPAKAHAAGAPKHLSITYSQLADLLRAGVPLLRSLELLEHKTNHTGLKQVLEAVRGDVAEGTRLGDAMSKHPKVFSELAVSMVRAGEEGAFVEDVLKRIADFTDHQEMLKSRVTGRDGLPHLFDGDGIGCRRRHAHVLRAEIHADLRAHVEPRATCQRQQRGCWP